jgi:membrane-bound metal-dependent hydrolase YbcI (DUF457 family)
MTYRGHTAVGGIVAAGAWVLTPPELLHAGIVMRAVLIAFVMIGALAPDLDLPQSYPSRRLLGPLRFVVSLFKFCISNPLTWLLFGHAPARRPPVRLIGARRAWWWVVLPFRWLGNGRQRIVWIVRHRGFSHSLLGVGLASVTLGAAVCIVDATLAIEIALAFGLGCLSHLFADALTVSGVPLCLPWSDRRIGIGPRFLRLRSN